MTVLRVLTDAGWTRAAVGLTKQAMARPRRDATDHVLRICSLEASTQSQNLKSALFATFRLSNFFDLIFNHICR